MHAIRQSPQFVQVRIRGGGTAGPIGPAGTVPPIGGTGRCRAIARHGVWCRPTGRRKTAWQRPGSKPAAALLPAGPIGPAEWCRPIGRHGVWCRQSAARSTVPPDMVPPIGGTEYGAAQWGGTGYGAAYWRHGSWRRGFGQPGTVRRLADRVGRAADGGRSELGIPRPGCGVWECGAWECGAWECGAWECGCPGMRMSGDAGVRGCGCPGMWSLGEMRSPGTARRPDWAGGSGAALLGGTVPAAASRAAGRSAGGRRGGGVARLLREPRKDAWGRPGVLPSCGTAGAARPAWCRLGMVPPGYGAAYWRHGSWRRGSWRHGVAGRMRAGLHGACNWRRGSLAARFPGLCGAGRGGMSKNSLLAWMTRAGAGSVWRNGVWGMGERGRGNGIGGTASGCWGLPGWRRGSGGCRGRRVWWRPLENGAWKNRVWKNGAWGCGVGVRGTGPEERRLGVRGMGKESRSRGRVSQ